jgi:hypothetical protein
LSKEFPSLADISAPRILPPALKPVPKENGLLSIFPEDPETPAVNGDLTLL